MGDGEKRIWFDGGYWWFRCGKTREVMRLTLLIHDNAYRVSLVAKALGLGLRTFERIVVEDVGLSPGVWLRRERAVASRHGLRSAMTVKEVAVFLGFRHQGDFSDEFRRWHGVSPESFKQAEWRMRTVSAEEIAFCRKNLNENS